MPSYLLKDFSLIINPNECQGKKRTQREQETILPALPREEPIKSSRMAEYIEKGEHKRDRPGPLEFGGTDPRLLSASVAS